MSGWVNLKCLYSGFLASLSYTCVYPFRYTYVCVLPFPSCRADATVAFSCSVKSIPLRRPRKVRSIVALNAGCDCLIAL
jgi:hypothetical protein